MSDLDELKNRLLAQPLGSMTKRELELLVLDVLIARGLLPQDAPALSAEIRNTLLKTHGYLTDLALRKDRLSEGDAISRLVAVLDGAEIVGNSGTLVFAIHDAELRIWVEQTLARRGLLQGESLRRDIVKLSARALASLLFEGERPQSPEKLLALLRQNYDTTDWFIDLQRSVEANDCNWSGLLSNGANAVSFLQGIQTLIRQAGFFQ